MSNKRLDSFLHELKQLKNEEQAILSKRYHKSQREHWGLSAPNYQTIILSFTKDLNEEEILLLAEALWNTNLFDPMLCAAKLLSLKKVKASPALWTLIKKFLKQVDGWALEDVLAPAAEKCLLDNGTRLDELEEWTKHPNFWMRRAALVYTLPFAKKGRDPERMLKWASTYADDPEWFIQKAIGWWLRFLGSHNPERVITFLQSYGSRLKGVAKKEATRKLSQEHREAGLNKAG